jgi:Ni2+-binding GTPase involved in maturation of urease and hydrogenase
MPLGKKKMDDQKVTTPASRADYIMVGGFLGAGKTTALLRMAEYLTARGRRVGLITNDQSSGLVDTTIVNSHGYPVEEITGGCFCCRFNSLTEAADRLTESAAPDVFLAEPVGSCTDLRASVQYPLRRLYGDNYRIAPLSVLVDPIRAMRILGLESGKAFSPKVLYVYSKQLEEADIIVINKMDLIDPEKQARLEGALRSSYPCAELFAVSARIGTGLDGWFHRVVSSEPDSRPAPDVDYDMYAEGEALLGWFNATFRVTGSRPFDGNLLLVELGRQVRTGLLAEHLEIAHFKMTLTPDENVGDIAVANLVGSDREPELSHTLQAELTSGELIVNLRAEGDPEFLKQTLSTALRSAASGTSARVETLHLEHFRPARPVPTYRMATERG